MGGCARVRLGTDGSGGLRAVSLAVVAALCMMKTLTMHADGHSKLFWRWPV